MTALLLLLVQLLREPLAVLFVCVQPGQERLGCDRWQLGGRVSLVLCDWLIFLLAGRALANGDLRNEFCLHSRFKPQGRCFHA